MAKKAYLKILPDEDAISPLEGTGWRVVNALARETHGLSQGEIRRRIKNRTAFTLKCYRHSCEVWSLMEEHGPKRFYHHGDWDTTPNAGLLIYGEDTKYLPKTHELRHKLAQDVIDGYSRWVNGESYGFVWEDEDGETLDSCWSFYSYEDAKAAALEDGAPPNHVAVVAE